MSKIAYFGPAGTFTEQAAGVFDPSAQLVPYPTIRATATTAAIPMPIDMEIFIKQRYNSELNSDRILARAITK